MFSVLVMEVDKMSLSGDCLRILERKGDGERERVRAREIEKERASARPLMNTRDHTCERSKRELDRYGEGGGEQERERGDGEKERE